MFSTGQLIFATIFFFAFMIIIAYSYKKDKKWHERSYKGVKYVLISFVLFIIILFMIKHFLKN